MQQGSVTIMKVMSVSDICNHSATIPVVAQVVLGAVAWNIMYLCNYYYCCHSCKNYFNRNQFSSTATAEH
jgi:hypothetical protein